jgi:hypothetical protein
VLSKTIHLHVLAPAKPLEGQPCNGCGVCCALETCPAARLRFWQQAGPCPALRWSDQAARYYCGLLLEPGRYLSFLPQGWAPSASALIARWIAADQGCDCSADIDTPS